MAGSGPDLKDGEHIPWIAPIQMTSLKLEPTVGRDPGLNGAPDPDHPCLLTGSSAQSKYCRPGRLGKVASLGGGWG